MEVITHPDQASSESLTNPVPVDHTTGEGVGRGLDVAGFMQSHEIFDLLKKKGLKSVSATESLSSAED
jgi:hypothetical protein